MNKKILIGFIVFLLFVGGGAFVLTRSSATTSDNTPFPAEEVGKISLSPEFIDAGQIVMKEGLVNLSYELKNESTSNLTLRKIVTSCMCTAAAVEVDGKSTSFYKMEMGGDKNPRISFEIPAGKTAKVNVRFDPAAHGIQGVGKFDRVIWLTFEDPVGVREVKFAGEVVLKK